MLREYQQRAIDMLYKWLSQNTGHPCVVMPTGSGKSHVIAALCKDALQNWPETKILMLTHVKELIEQNAEKMLQHWHDAPLGIYSASVGRKDLGDPIIFAGIQSLRDKAKQIGTIDILLVDECHLINHKEEGLYRKLINDLIEINSNMRVIGFTATPWRLGHGLITGESALFNDLIEPVSIEELIYKQFLSPLRSKITNTKLDISDVKKSGGEYIEHELQKAVNTEQLNQSVIKEVIFLAKNRKSWLFFCSGVSHAENICHILKNNNISCECVTGETSKKQRERILKEFKSGKIQAITNANVLTTGFDAPDIDLIVMLRPTMSPTLYVQMAGRGMRIKKEKKDCLILDFAGVVETHGPITNIELPKKKGQNGEAPIKICPDCNEILHISIKQCPVCEYTFPEKELKELYLRHDDIMGMDSNTLEITDWKWRVHTSRNNGKKMLSVTYYGNLSEPPVTEYLTIFHEGYAQQKAMALLMKISKNAEAIFTNDVKNINEDPENSLSLIVDVMNKSVKPKVVYYKKDGKFFRVLNRIWNYET